MCFETNRRDLLQERVGEKQKAKREKARVEDIAEKQSHKTCDELYRKKRE